jgi:hypothetical protein
LIADHPVKGEAADRLVIHHNRGYMAQDPDISAVFSALYYPLPPLHLLYFQFIFL